MAKIKSGITGSMSGTISNVTGYRRLGKNIIQAKPLKKNIAIATGLIDNSNRAKQLSVIIRKYAPGIQLIKNAVNCNNYLPEDQLIMQNLQAIDWLSPTFFFQLKLTDESMFPPFVKEYRHFIAPRFADITLRKIQKIRLPFPAITQQGTIENNGAVNFQNTNIPFTSNVLAKGFAYGPPSTQFMQCGAIKIFSNTPGNPAIVRALGVRLIW